MGVFIKSKSASADQRRREPEGGGYLNGLSTTSVRHFSAACSGGEMPDRVPERTWAHVVSFLIVVCTCPILTADFNLACANNLNYWQPTDSPAQRNFLFMLNWQMWQIISAYTLWQKDWSFVWAREMVIW